MLLPKRSVQTVEVERFVCKCACRRLPSSSTDVEVYPVHVFNLRGPKIVSLGHLIKIINLTTFPTLRAIFENSTKGQLAARELPRIQALLGIFCGGRGAMGHGKDKK